MITPEEIAQQVMNQAFDNPGAFDTRAALIRAIKIDRAQREPDVTHVVFTGPFEVYSDINVAEDRVAELLDLGHNAPTVINAQLLDGEVAGLTARKHITVASPSSI